jgi:hypothetical protein
MQLKRKHMNRERVGMGDDDANGNGLWIAKNTEFPREKKKGLGGGKAKRMRRDYNI